MSLSPSTLLINVLSYASGCPLSTSALQKHVLLILQCLYICVWNLSLCFSHSISLPPSRDDPSLLHVDSLCISIFSSRSICVCLLCASVCLIVRKRERVYKFKGTPGIKVSILSLTHTHSLSLTLWFFVCLSLFSLWNQSRPLKIVSSEYM